MLNGKLGLSKADNGYCLTWYENLTPHCEVFVDAQACMYRIADVVGMVSGAPAARAFLAAAEASSGPDPSVDADIANLMPDHAPPSAFSGD